MKSKTLGARVPEKLYEYCNRDMNQSRTVMTAIFDKIVLEEGMNKLEELCGDFGPFKEYKYYTTNYKT